jgi:hypothetical protein
MNKRQLIRFVIALVAIFALIVAIGAASLHVGGQTANTRPTHPTLVSQTQTRNLALSSHLRRFLP